MASNEIYEIPDSGAVFTFGRSGFADNQQSHFFIRNDPVVEISCGDEHTAIVCQNGRVFVFGHNDYGQLGLGHTRTISKPSCLKYLKPFHSTHVACGKGHTIISTECGRLFSFGSNSDGQLGTGDLRDKLTPQLVNTKKFTEGGISAVSAGCFHSACLTENGELYIWGSNSDGQCGSEVDTNLLIPTKVDFNNRISTMSCGYYHTAFISDGILYSFGEEDNGKLGYKKVNASNSPEKVELDFTCAQVVCGGNHTLVLSDNGKVFSCGSNFSGQLGIGNSSAEVYSFTPITFERDDINIIHISAGENHSAFITETGELYTCGDGRYGKTCSETESVNFIFPTLITLFAQFQCTFVSCGGCQTMVLAKHKTDKTYDSENARISSLPPLKMNKSLHENETIPGSEMNSPTVENTEEDNLRSQISHENIESEKKSVDSNTDEIGLSTENAFVENKEGSIEEGPSENEGPIDEQHTATAECVTTNDDVEVCDESETDVMISKESGIKKLLNVFHKSATSKRSSNRRKGTEIKNAATGDFGYRQTSRACCII